MEKEEERTIKDEIQIAINRIGCKYGSTDSGRIVNGLQDLAKVVSLSSELVVNELKLLREDLKKS